MPVPVPAEAAPPAPPQPGEPGWLLGGRYRVTDRIGAGGMAEVFRAHDQLLARDVAVKVFRTHSDPDDVTGGVQRQELELQTLARLSHPNLITLFDGSIGSDGEPAFLVMELINGPSLAAQIVQAPLTEPETREIAIQIAGALAYVHSQHMVHRDIKPANILLGTDSAAGEATGGTVRARLSDFGIVRLLGSEHLTSADFMVGTASYLAPEQARGAEVGPAADIYALGLVLIEALTGRRSYEGPALEAVLARLDRSPEIPAGLPQPWPELLPAMTAMDPQLRPGAAEVARTLREGVAMPVPMLAGTGSDLLAGNSVLAGDAVLAGGAPLAAASGLTGTTALPLGGAVTDGAVPGGAVTDGAVTDGAVTGSAVTGGAVTGEALGDATVAAATPVDAAMEGAALPGPAASPELATAFIAAGLPPMPPPVDEEPDQLDEPERHRGGARGPLLGAAVAAAALIAVLTAGGLILTNQSSTKNPSVLPGQAVASTSTTSKSPTARPTTTSPTSVAPIGSIPSSGAGGTSVSRSSSATPTRSSASPTRSSASPTRSSAPPNSSSAAPSTSASLSSSSVSTSSSASGSSTPTGSTTTTAAPAGASGPGTGSPNPTKSG
jgi:eukaryotic-like serine/threonine-protein kinase